MSERSNRDFIGIIKFVAISMTLSLIFLISGLCVLYIKVDQSNHDTILLGLLTVSVSYLIVACYASLDLCNICINNWLKKRKNQDNHGHPV
jgi:hypothetical protein